MRSPYLYTYFNIIIIPTFTVVPSINEMTRSPKCDPSRWDMCKAYCCMAAIRHWHQQKKIMILVCLLILGLVVVGYVSSYFIWDHKRATHECSKVTRARRAEGTRVRAASRGMLACRVARALHGRSHAILATNMCRLCLVHCRRR